MVKLARLSMLVAVVGLAGLPATGAAFAADMRVKAPVPAVSYGWTGFYIGGNAGLSIARNPTEAPTTDPFFGVVTNEAFHLSPLGAVGGVQFGFNWQVTPNWVWGVEADFQGSSQKDSRTCVFLCTTNNNFGVTRVETFTQRLPWFGTLRARLGWIDGPMLFYVTGGLAYGRITTDFDFFAAPAATSTAGRFSDDKWGPTVGGGIEAQLSGNWTGKLEYLYVDLGTVSGAATAVGGGFAGRVFGFSSDVHEHIVRLGVNYKLGDPVYVAPARAGGVYKAPAAAVAYSWSGLYLGGNVGLSVARNPSTAPIIDPTGAGVLANSQFYLSPMGVVGGGQIGFNWQAAANVVWGVEADFQASGQKDSKTCLAGCEPPAGGGFVEPITQEIPWFGTLRARLGWTNGPVLFYATGGWAYGKITTDLILNQPALAGSFSQNKSGWTVGGGIEAQLLGNWTGKLEYLYMDLGTVAGNVTSATGLIAGFSSEVHDHIVRVGLNYKLDWAGPVRAKY